MPSESVKQVQAQDVQRKASKRATLDVLRSKKRRTKELFLVVNDDEVSFELRAVGSVEYDRLITECPPNTEQRANGASYNINTFAPALMAKVIIDPELSVDEWSEIWRSPDWNRGELMTLFSECVEICNVGLSLGPTDRG